MLKSAALLLLGLCLNSGCVSVRPRPVAAANLGEAAVFAWLQAGLNRAELAECGPARGQVGDYFRYWRRHGRGGAAGALRALAAAPGAADKVQALSTYYSEEDFRRAAAMLHGGFEHPLPEGAAVRLQRLCITHDLAALTWRTLAAEAGAAQDEAGSEHARKMRDKLVSFRRQLARSLLAP